MRIACILFMCALPIAFACTGAGEPAAPPSPAPPAPAAGAAAEQPATATPPASDTSDLPSDVRGSILGKNIWETFQAGGFLMWPILGCSLVGLAFAMERVVALRQKAVAPRDLPREVIAAVSNGGTAAALRVCEKRPSSLARVLAAGISVAGESREEIDRAMEEAGEREMWDLNRYAKPLVIIAGVAPLLGLLGTVQGMIMAFDTVAQKGAMGDPRQLAAGIATALFTTFAGLTVAIPAYVLYHYFRDKSDRMVVEIEETATRVAKALKGAPAHAHPPSAGGGRRAPDDAAH